MEKQKSEKMVKTTIVFREEVLKALQHRVIDEGRSMQEVVNRAITRYLKSGGGAKKSVNE
jgi:hypothetical protein